MAEKGRPKKTEEEKRETKRIYMKYYQKLRYREDDEYREKKKKKSLDNYNKNVKININTE